MHRQFYLLDLSHRRTPEASISLSHGVLGDDVKLGIAHPITSAIRHTFAFYIIDKHSYLIISRHNYIRLWIYDAKFLSPPGSGIDRLREHRCKMVDIKRHL